MQSFILGTFILILASGVRADTTHLALKFVPGATVVQEKDKEIKLRTTAGTLVEIEFDAAGNFEEASGDNVERDIFIPDQKLLSLEVAASKLKSEGKSPVGEWSLEHIFLKGWHYEFEGYENGQKYNYVVDAKNGKLANKKLDD